jgi:hypothetical protein
MAAYVIGSRFAGALRFHGRLLGLEFGSLRAQLRRVCILLGRTCSAL